jgi:hypothetical protein
MYKISGTPRTELAGGTGGAGSVKPDRNYVPKSNIRQVGRDLQTIGDLLEANLWSLLRECRMFAQRLDQKPFFPIY